LATSQVKQGAKTLEATLKEAVPDKDEAARLSQVRLLIRYKP